jgi:polyamine oxidase
MGCNWVQALGTNPVNLLSQKYNMKTVPTDYEDIDYIDQHGRHVNGSKEQQA